MFLYVTVSTLKPIVGIGVTTPPCVCVCVCVRERERERERQCVRVFVCAESQRKGGKGGWGRKKEWEGLSALCQGVREGRSLWSSLWSALAIAPTASTNWCYVHRMRHRMRLLRLHTRETAAAGACATRRRGATSQREQPKLVQIWRASPRPQA
jgi:hypothetical protein